MPSIVPDATMTASFSPVAAMLASSRVLYGLVSVKLSGSVETRLAIVLDPLAVEQHLQPLGRADAEVVRALRADVQVGREILVVDDLRSSPGHLTHSPSGTRLALSLAGAIGLRAFLNQAILKVQYQAVP